MKISIASGKGGTGKTTVATNLALSLENVQLFDCDVEEPNAHLFLDLKLEKIEDVRIHIPVIDKDTCVFCGECAKFCQYNALAVVPSDVLFFPELCHGCGGCTLVCPKDAITEVPRIIGMVEKGTMGHSRGKRNHNIGITENISDSITEDISDSITEIINENITENIEFYHGLLNVGEHMATPVIKSLKKRIDGKKDAILDSPPGTSCPVIETIRDTDFCLLVTEPTPFGIHDLKLAVDVVRKMDIPFGVIINRDGVGNDMVERFCQMENIPVLMKIPQSEEIAKLYSNGIPFVTHLPEWKEKFLALYTNLKKAVNQ